MPVSQNECRRTFNLPQWQMLGLITCWLLSQPFLSISAIPISLLYVVLPMTSTVNHMIKPGFMLHIALPVRLYSVILLLRLLLFPLITIPPLIDSRKSFQLQCSLTLRKPFGPYSTSKLASVLHHLLWPSRQLFTVSIASPKRGNLSVAIKGRPNFLTSDISSVQNRYLQPAAVLSRM